MRSLPLASRTCTKHTAVQPDGDIMYCVKVQARELNMHSICTTYVSGHHVCGRPYRGVHRFGFLDNFLMLIFGEEIDHLFGAKLGFTTLASAGLGNAVADVVGVGAANYIEVRRGEARSQAAQRRGCESAARPGSAGGVRPLVCVCRHPRGRVWS